MRWVACVALLCCGCGYEYSESQVMTELAQVSETVYSPGHTHYDLVFIPDGDGDLTPWFMDSSVAPKWSVVFQCQHGKFIVERRDIWDKVTEGDTVRVYYKELYRQWNGQGPKELYRFDFLNCERVGANVALAEVGPSDPAPTGKETH